MTDIMEKYFWDTKIYKRKKKSENVVGESENTNDDDDDILELNLESVWTNIALYLSRNNYFIFGNALSAKIYSKLLIKTENKFYCVVHCYTYTRSI